jgi:adenine-specific DNA-methyltransferase
MKYCCHKCHKTFAQKGHFEDHMNRKRPCKKDNSMEELVEQKVKEALLSSKVVIPPIQINYHHKTREELIVICKERNIKGYSGKKKEDIINLLVLTVPSAPSVLTVPSAPSVPEKIHRLNYIGSKFQLLDWITANIKEKTGWTSFESKTIADIFAGTGIVSYHFRKNMAKVISNDAELYSSIITHAFTRSIYTESCRNIIDAFQKDIQENKHSTTIGFITTHYSPHGPSDRRFFTIENAKRIDYIRNQLEIIKHTLTLTEDEYKFILASILLSADAISNVPAVYGCFLKNFKTKAVKNLVLTPIHNNTIPVINGSQTYHCDVLNMEFIGSFEADLVYLDPPYNERQYSKNYFPLNIIAKTPEQLLTEDQLKGKTGIPTDCFISPFCKKGPVVENAFDTLFRNLTTKWIFLSYNSESIVSKEKVLELMGRYGDVSVIERDYKRFKAYEYNEDLVIQEYLFCLKKKD